MNFIKHIKNKLSKINYTYLGEEHGLIFFRDDKGKVFGAREECFVDEEWLNKFK
jgi:hypothetical protein